MARKEETIKIRINEAEKTKWNKFVKANPKFSSLSGLIMYCVSSYVLGDLTENGKNTSSMDHEKLQEINDQYQKINERLEQKIDEMNAHLLSPESGSVSFEKLKGRILTLIEKLPSTYEVIAKLLDVDEVAVMKQLSELKKADLITFNKNMEYYIRG